MKIIDRYILNELLAPFFLGLFIFTFVMLTNVLVKLLDWFITKGVGLGTTIKLLGLSLPFILVMTIPMSVLLAVLIVFNRFSADSEITAMRASGISLHRIMPSVLLFAFFAYILASYIYIGILPASNLKVKQLKFDIIRSKASLGIKPHVFNTDFLHLVIYVNNVDHEKGLLQGVFIADNRDPEQPLIIVAHEGHELLNREEKTITLRLKEGCTHELFKGNNYRYSITPFESMDLNLNMNIFNQNLVSKSDREMTIVELYQKAVLNRSKGYSDNRQWVEIWKKTSLPFACIVFAVLGVPLGISTRRRGKSAAFATSILLILVYYIFLTGGSGLAEEGKIPPFLGVWFPNIILGALALYLYKNLSTESTSDWIIRSLERMKKGFLKVTRFGSKKATSVAGHSPSPHEKTRIHRLSFRMFRVLDQYVSIEFLRIFSYIIAALTAISIIVHIFEKIDRLVQYHALIHDALIAVWFKTPLFIYLSIPFSTLLATILTIGMFARTSELTAMKASGISYFRFAAPLVLSGFILMGMSYLLNESIVPAANRQVELAWDRIKKRERTRFVRFHRWYRGKKGDIYYFQHYDPDKKIITGFSRFVTDEKMNILKRLEAKTMKWEADRWIITQGRKLELDINGSILSDQKIEHYLNPIPETPDDFSKEYKDSEEMNVKELKEYIRILKGIGFDTTEYEVDWHAKFAIPFLSVVMVLIGISFASQHPRSGGGLMDVGKAILLGSLYFLFFRIGLEFGKAGRIPPFLSVWICNFLFFAFCSFLIYKASYQK